MRPNQRSRRSITLNVIKVIFDFFLFIELNHKQLNFDTTIYLCRIWRVHHNKPASPINIHFWEKGRERFRNELLPRRKRNKVLYNVRRTLFPIKITDSGISSCSRISLLLRLGKPRCSSIGSNEYARNF